MNLELNLPRWIYASATKYFSDAVAGRWPIYFEGLERNTEPLLSYLEFRLDGPSITEVTKGNFCVEFDVNILVTAHANTEDFHKVYKGCGIAVQCLKAFGVYRFGKEQDDDQALLECALIDNTAIRVSHFGKIDPVKPVLQSSVEGHYHFYVNG